MHFIHSKLIKFFTYYFLNLKFIRKDLKYINFLYMINFTYVAGTFLIAFLGAFLSTYLTEYFIRTWLIHKKIFN